MMFTQIFVFGNTLYEDIFCVTLQENIVSISCFHFFSYYQKNNLIETEFKTEHDALEYYNKIKGDRNALRDCFISKPGKA